MQTSFITKLKSFHWNLLFVLRPIGFSLGMLVVWHLMRNRHLHFAHESEGVMTCGVLVVIGLVYAIIAGHALESAWEDQKKMAEAIREHNRHDYLMVRDERVPIVIHLFLGALSFLLIVSTMLINYEEDFCGIVAVFTVSVVTSLFYFVVQKLDDPRGSPWFKRSIPESWDKVDMDKYRKYLSKKQLEKEKAIDAEMDKLPPAG